MSTAAMEREEIELANKTAWDTLYGQTDELIWGSEPLEFVRTALMKVRAMLPNSPLLLDAATGEGRNLPILLDFSDQVVACDSSANALHKLQKRFPDSIQTRLCDLADTTFSNNCFDAILACDVIETLPNLSEVLYEFNRILKSGGILICNVPDMQDSIAGENMEQLGESEYLYKDRFFYRFQQKSDFIQFLYDEGFALFDTFTDTWIEEAHPEYRQDRHSHTSQIIIARKRHENEVI
ncbi:MAG: class I SAM-dependent methyltransferase [Planctomycetia bacterium]|nr:class I SAM-dependent methyltransferase [Planctomycetia bacterium]